MKLGLNANNPLEYAKMQYESVGEEKLVSGSDDFTLFLWKPEKDKKPIGILMHNQINIVKKKELQKYFFL